MPRIERAAILQKFHRMRDEGRPIIGGGAGTGLSARSEEAGGIDLIVIYNSGRYRMAGRGLRPGCWPLAMPMTSWSRWPARCCRSWGIHRFWPGSTGQIPSCCCRILAELKHLGFSGVQNFPTIGLFDGAMRQSFEETGLGFGREVDMIAAAHGADLLTTPYVFNPDEARAMVRAGADIVVAHMGVTTGGDIGAQAAKSLDSCIAEIDSIAQAALSIRKDVLVLCHGGPISMPEDARYVLDRAPDCHGFYGASSIERLPSKWRSRRRSRHSRR